MIYALAVNKWIGRSLFALSFGSTKGIRPDSMVDHSESTLKNRSKLKWLCLYASLYKNKSSWQSFSSLWPRHQLNQCWFDKRKCFKTQLTFVFPCGFRTNIDQVIYSGIKMRMMMIIIFLRSQISPKVLALTKIEHETLREIHSKILTQHKTN